MKKWISILLSAAMTATLLTVPVHADSDNDKVTITVTAIKDDDSTLELLPSAEEHVPVAGATVNMYSGQGAKGESVELEATATTSPDGTVTFDLSEYSEEERASLTFSANKVIAGGSGIGDGNDGGNRDALFSKYRGDRLQLELHSETIDSNGNWLGKKMPTGNGKDVDLAFVIDASGSMGNDIDNVRSNLNSIAQSLWEDGYDLRISIVDYNNGGNDNVNVHYNSAHSPWFDVKTEEDVQTVQNELSKISTTGGTNEPLNSLGYLTDYSTMMWRSSASKFAILLTDADIEGDRNSWGYSSITDAANALIEENVVTSVITENDEFMEYTQLASMTGGKMLDILSDSFGKDLEDFSREIIGQSGSLELTLSEPRMLVNMSVCYYADDEESQSDEYFNMVADRMKDYSKYLAQATDGHVFIKNAYIFRTDNRNNFYFTSSESENSDYSNVSLAAMSDIRIITKIKDDGSGLFSNAKIRSNANTTGFYSSDTEEIDSDNYEKFKKLDQLVNGKEEFCRIMMSGSMGGGWSYTLEDSKYSETIVHETGHYLLAFRDEYQDKNSKDWWFINRPYDNYGLMDKEHEDIEISKDAIDYYYTYDGLIPDFTNDDNATEHSFDRGMSCESSLAYLMENGSYPWSRAAIQKYYDENSSEMTDEKRTEYEEWLNGPYQFSPVRLFDIDDINDEGYRYKIKYSTTSLPLVSSPWSNAEVHDKTVEYPYAECNIVDWATTGIPQEVNDDNIVVASNSSSDKTLGIAATSLQSFADINAAEVNGDNIVLDVDQGSEANIKLFYRRANGLNDSVTEELTITDGHATLPLKNGQSCELIVTSENNGVVQKNTHIIERSLKSDKGYYYQSNDLSVEAYVIPVAEDEHTFITISLLFENGEYKSVNNALRIASINDIDARGELYSVASVNGDIDYTTISWFKYDGTNWTKLDTDLSTEENMNIGARCDYAGEGTYVLMAKLASDEQLKPVTDITYTNPTDRDGIVNLSFTDDNTNTAYYNIYYSDTDFESEDDGNVAMRKVYAGSDYYSIDLDERNKDGYAAIVAVAENGAKSPLSEVVKVNTGEADRDGDGIPDWYCDKYLLWPPSGEEKDIANSDDDNDGLTNLEEYKGGSDPTDPNDPVKTSNVAVDSVELDKETIRVNVGRTATVTAEIKPADASNQKVQWYTDNEAIATVSGDGLECTIEGVAEGTTRVTAVTEDGGYTASTEVTVSRSSGGSGGSGGGMTTLSGVKADVDSGKTERGTQVSLSHSDSGVTIYYTTDGSTPTASSTRYTSPITVNEDMTIKAIAVKSGYRNSSVAIFKYTVDDTPVFILKENAADISYMPAYDDNTFKPDRAATRYEILDALNNLFDFENITYVLSFPDVNAANEELVNKFVCTDVIDGYEDGTFRGDNGITRAELVKILSIMFEIEDNGYGDASYSDISGHWARSYINTYAKSGYVNGYPDGTFKPDNQVTRAEFVRIVNNILGVNNNADVAYNVIPDMDSSHWAYNDIAHAVK